MRTRGIQLEVSDGRAPVDDLAAVQTAVADLGAGVWPLDLTRVPRDFRVLIDKPSLTDRETQLLLAHFLLSRERLLAIIARAGRRPHVPGGGNLTTVVSTHGYSYPQLYVVEAGADFSRFDTFHVNRSDDGVAVDEIMQMLCGEGLIVHQRRADGLVFTLRLSCPSEGSGWLLTYDGGRPHIGSFSLAAPGTKCLVQVIGPASWGIHYLDE